MVVKFHVFEFGAEVVFFDKDFSVSNEAYNVDVGLKHVEQIIDKCNDMHIHVFNAIFHIHCKSVVIRHPVASVNVIVVVIRIGRIGRIGIFIVHLIFCLDFLVPFCFLC